MKKVEIVVKWKCDYCDAVFDSENQCESHEKAFCLFRPELRALAENCKERWYASKDESKVFKIRYYDWNYGYFLSSVYGDSTRILSGYITRLEVDEVLTAHEISSSKAKKLIYQYSKDIIGVIE